MKNRICELLGIDVPIVQGAMQWLAVPELAAAVSNAGGLGIISAATFPGEGELAAQIRKMKTLTSRPFAVNISLLPGRANTEKAMAYIDAVVSEGVPIVETSGRSPEDLVGPLKAAGIKIIHKAPSVKFAKKAEGIGVDAVTVISFESGGHPGMGDATTMIQIQLRISFFRENGSFSWASFSLFSILYSRSFPISIPYIYQHQFI